MRYAMKLILFYAFCYLVGVSTGTIAAALLPFNIAFPLALIVTLAISYVASQFFVRGFKQTVVDFVFFAWWFMPTTYKQWAFRNDKSIY